MQISPFQRQNSLYPTISSHGFLLTRSSKDVGNKIIITLWLKTERGAVELVIEDERAIFFVEQSSKNDAQRVLKQQNIHLDEIKAVPLKTFNQVEVVACYFVTLRAFYQARDALKTANIKCYEDDFRPDERYLMERFITADIHYVGQDKTTAMSQTEQAAKYRRVEDVKCKQRQKQNVQSIKLNMVSLDIECSMAGELYSIGFYGSNIQQVFMIANNEEISIEQERECGFDILWKQNEKQLLNSLITWFDEYDPDIIIGWNVINFDFNLLQKRFDLYGIKFAIGRDNSAPRWRKNSNTEQQFIDINGRVILDGIDLLKTATFSFPSFSLDNVANTLLGIGKKVDDVENRMDEINHNFAHNKTALAEYNLEDCRLVLQIFEHTQLLEFAILRAQLTGLSIDRIGGSVAAFTNLYLPKLHRSGYVAPNMGDGDQGFESPGGFVMDSIPGLYDNVLVLDFKSLYPSIIRSFNIDPMGLIEGLREPSTAISGFDGAMFSRDKHFLPQIINELWQERDKAKLDKNAALSQAIKIIMNSFYGILGSTGCRFFDPRLSGSITKRSHLILKTTKSWIEAKKFSVIYGDTDSIFVHVGDDKTQSQCKKLGLELQTFINDKWRCLLTEEFKIESELEIEFETHFTKFLMPTVRGQDIGTKKRYAGLVISEGKQHIVFKGLESVRTDWTELAKQFQRALYDKVFNDEPVDDYIRMMVEKTLAGEHDDLLFYRKRLRRKLETYVKNVPPHVRAARNADEINRKNGVALKFQNKGWIEYVMTTSGPQAKGYQNSPLDYQFYIDRQLLVVADAILPFIDKGFEAITSAQMTLFTDD